MVSSNYIRVGSLTSETGVVRAGLTVNGAAAIAGDITYTLLGTSLTTQMSGKANLSEASFTGQITSQFSVHLMLYGTASAFNSAGTAQTPLLSTGW